MKVRVWLALTVALLGAPVAAQSTCPPGEILNPDTGACETDPGSNPGSGTGGTDDGLIPRLLRFYNPNDGDSFAAGTQIAPTGRTSLTNVQNIPLDLTIVIDDSQSMRTRTTLPNESTPDPNDFLTRLDVVKQGALSLIDALPLDAVISVVSFGNGTQSITEKPLDANFNGVVDQGAGATREDVKTAVENLQGVGATTDYGAAFTQVFQLDNASNVSGFTSDLYDKELLFLSDGQPAAPNYFTFINALPFRGIDPLFVSLPGNSLIGNMLLEDAATRSGGRFFDFSRDVSGLLGAFEDPAQTFFGITSLEITNPDGARYAATTDAFGNFTLDPFALADGDNVFTATAFFEDGTQLTDSLTVVGTSSTTPAPVPLPGTVWLLLSALGGSAALFRSRSGRSHMS